MNFIRKVPRVTKMVVAYLSIGTLITAGAATAGPAAAEPQQQAAAAAVNKVKVYDALLRSQPNTRSTKLDVSQPGRVVYLYCWVRPRSGANYIWFRAHPRGSRFTGWMRADLINWATYPAPYRC